MLSLKNTHFLPGDDLYCIVCQFLWHKYIIYSFSYAVLWIRTNILQIWNIEEK